MRRSLSIATLALLLMAAPALAVDVDAKRAEFDAVIAEQCVKCHTRERIDQALEQGENLEAILEKMLRFGVKLSERDQKVLGTFWGEPLK